MPVPPHMEVACQRQLATAIPSLRWGRCRCTTTTTLAVNRWTAQALEVSIFVRLDDTHEGLSAHYFALAYYGNRA